MSLLPHCFFHVNDDGLPSLLLCCHGYIAIAASTLLHWHCCIKILRQCSALTLLGPLCCVDVAMLSFDDRVNVAPSTLLQWRFCVSVSNSRCFIVRVACIYIAASNVAISKLLHCLVHSFFKLQTKEKHCFLASCSDINPLCEFFLVSFGNLIHSFF